MKRLAQLIDGRYVTPPYTENFLDPSNFDEDDSGYEGDAFSVFKYHIPKTDFSKHVTRVRGDLFETMEPHRRAGYCYFDCKHCVSTKCYINPKTLDDEVYKLDELYDLLERLPVDDYTIYIRYTN